MIVLNSKHSVVFFSAGVILMLLLIIVGVPMNAIPAAQQQTSDSLNEMQDDGKSNENTIVQTKPIKQMNCSELNQFIISFEKGWSTAIPMYDEKCS